MPAIDYSALSASVHKQDVKDFRRSNPQLSSKVSGQTTWFAAIFIVGLAVFDVSFGGSIINDAGNDPIRSVAIFATLAAVAVAIIFVALVVRNATWARFLRLARFSRANGLSFTADGNVPPYPGMIFGIGSSRTVPERISRLSEPFFDIGNLSYTTGSGKSRKTHQWSYVALKLDRMLPHMILDAKSNNFLFSNLPNTFSRSQVLSLEGDFDRHFTLYCPQEYEQDALYILTPDLMARMIDSAANFDVEIIDDWMFFYSMGVRDLSDSGTLSSVVNLIDSVGTKTLSRTERYADDRMTAITPPESAGAQRSSRMAINQVAFQGRRLRQGVPVVAILIAVAIGAWWLLNLILGNQN